MNFGWQIFQTRPELLLFFTKIWLQITSFKNNHITLQVALLLPNDVIAHKVLQITQESMSCWKKIVSLYYFTDSYLNLINTIVHNPAYIKQVSIILIFYTQLTWQSHDQCHTHSSTAVYQFELCIRLQHYVYFLVLNIILWI